MFSGDETGLQWEDYLFELQTAVEWRLVMSRGQDDRSQMHAISLLLNTCSGMTNRVLIDDGARWILQGDEQERENRTAGVKALHSMLAATTSGYAKELVKQGLSERNGMIAFGRIRERFGKTAGVAKLSDVFHFQWTSPDSLEDKGLRWQKLMRQVNMTSLGDDAREMLTNAGLEKAWERFLEQHLRLLRSTNLDSVECKCGSVLANDGGLEQSAHANGNWCRDIVSSSRINSWSNQTLFGWLRTSVLSCARTRRQNVLSFTRVLASVVSIISCDLHGHTILQEKRAADVYDELGNGPCRGSSGGLTEDSSEQATLSAGQSGIGYKRARDTASPGHLGHSIQPKRLARYKMQSWLAFYRNNLW